MGNWNYIHTLPTVIFIGNYCPYHSWLINQPLKQPVNLINRLKFPINENICLYLPSFIIFIFSLLAFQFNYNKCIVAIDNIHDLLKVTLETFAFICFMSVLKLFHAYFIYFIKNIIFNEIKRNWAYIHTYKRNWMSFFIHFIFSCNFSKLSHIKWKKVQ